MTTGRITACAFIIGYAAAPVSAAEFAYNASLSAGRSDNVGLTADNEQEEDIAAAGLRFSLAQSSARLEVDAVGDLAYVEYLDDTYDSDLLGSFAGNARFRFVPERFEWMISDNFGQVLTDPFTPPTPGNRENVNYLTTGPDATLALGSQSRLRLSGRYSLGTYEYSPLDFDTLGGGVTLERDLSSASAVSLHVTAARTEYDEATLDADYDQNDAFVRYQVTGARTSLGLDAGYTVLDRDTADDKEDGLLLRMDVVRRVSSASTISLAGGREFSNSGVAFAGMQTIGGVGQGTASGRQTAQPFLNDSAHLGWNFARQRTAFGLFASWSEQSYEDDNTLDQTLTGGGGRFSRELSPRTSLGLQAQYSQVDYQVGADYDDLYADVNFSWQLSQHMSLTATYGYYERMGDLPGSDAKENRYLLSISYGQGTPRDVLAGPQTPVDARR